MEINTTPPSRVYNSSQNEYEVNVSWIKKQILNSYVKDSSGYDNNLKRKLVINLNYSNDSRLGYIFFAIKGTPPKGCAIYQIQHKFLIIIDAWGKTKKFNDIILKDISEIIKSESELK
jgi:hypothetical protein